VAKPEGRGFGSLVIERNLSRALDGEVSLEFAPGGLICRVTVPEQHLSPGR
jgi:two-component sensor histidine kinase